MAKEYDVIIIGGGVSGTALLYMLEKYTDIKSIALFEKFNVLKCITKTLLYINV